MTQVLLIAIFSALAIAILWRPYLGVVVVVTSVSAVELVSGFPLATSVISALGGVTVIAYLFHRLRPSADRITGWTKGHSAGLIFILWILASNPEAALSLGTRVWFWTFVQLWMIAWLAGKLLLTTNEHRVLIWFYSAIAIVSAGYVIQQGSIGVNLNDTIRGEGLAGGANSAARYIVVALVFLNYLRRSVKNAVLHWLVIGAMGCSVVGVVYTVSRTGMLLLVGVIAMIVFERTHGRQRKSLGLLFVGALVFVFFIPDHIWDIFRSVAPSIEQGTDTVGLRYKLWEAGLAMWRDHPLTGVGIGQFPYHLHSYGVTRVLGAHNMYVQVLAETGIIGLALFLILLWTSVMALWRAARCADKELSSLAKAWLTVFVVLLLGAMTKHDQADKLLWGCIGVSCYFELRTRRLAAHAKSRIHSGRRLRLGSPAVRPATMLIPVRRSLRNARTARGTS